MANNTVNITNSNNTVTITPQDNNTVNTETTLTSVSVTQGSTSVVTVNTPGPQGIQGEGANIDTGSLVTTSSFTTYTGSADSTFAGTSSFATSASYSLTSSYVNPLNQLVQISGSLETTGSTNLQYLTASGLIYPTIDGERGDILQTDGEGNLTFERTKIYAQVKNKAGTLLYKGTPVHVIGSIGNLDEVIAASASNASTMPATFVLAENLNNDEEGLAILTGFINGVNTSGFGEGDVVYVGENGGYTNLKPTGSNLIQNLGIVTKVGTNGSGFIYGSGRSNDVPNLLEGNIFFGSGSNQAYITHISSALDSTTINNITSSGTISAITGAFSHIIGNSPIVVGDPVTFQYPITASIISASEFIGADPFPYTGSAVISGSLNVIGDITGSSKLELNTPNNNVIVGYQAGQNDPSNQNVFVGYQAGKNITTGKHVAIGYQAGANISNLQSIAIGHLAGGSGGAYNITLGADARRNSAGQANISIGHAAFRSHGSNNNAVGIGYAVGRFGGGTGAVLLGYQAGYYLSGDYNIGLGYDVGYDLTGEYNTVLGYQAGYNLTGSKNVVLGHQAGYNLTGSNQLIIANNSSSALITGDFVNNTLDISGSVSASTYYGDGSNLTGIETDPFPYIGSAIISGSLEVTGSTHILAPNSLTNNYNFTIGTPQGKQFWAENDGNIRMGARGSQYVKWVFDGGNRVLELNNFTIKDNSVYDLRFQAGTNGNLVFTAPKGSNVFNNKIYLNTSQTDSNFPNNYLNIASFNPYVNHLQSYTVIKTNDSSYGGNSIPGLPLHIYTGQNTTTGVYGHLILQSTPLGGKRGNVGIGLEDPQTELHVSGAVSASTYYGDGSNLTGIETDPFPYTGSAAISGSLEIDGVGNTLVFDTIDYNYLNTRIKLGYNNTGISLTTTNEIHFVGNNIAVLGIKGNTYAPEVRLKSSTLFGFSNVDTNGALGVHFSRLDNNTIRVGTGGVWNASGSLLLTNITASGHVSASTYYGDGSNLTGVSSDPFPYTGSAIISGSLEVVGDITGSLSIEGSGSTLFEVNGSSGQLFSITDSLSGSLFAVSDVSGLPILEVFSDDTIKMGSFNAEALEISGSDVNFNNLPTSDPGVAGRLYQTGSDAIGATAGFQVVCISQG